MAGVGLQQTKVTLLADPNLDKNIHSIQVSGVLVQLRLKLAIIHFHQTKIQVT